MKDLDKLLREGIEAAYDLHAGDRPPAPDVKRRVVKRGRRRRAGRVVASVVLSVALVGGATSATQAFLPRETKVASRNVPDMGAERLYEFGGPITGEGSSLWLGEGKYSNDAGDRNSIARLDLETGDVTDGSPEALLPHTIVLGESGLWTVSWTGDMPVGGKGHPVRGSVERFDPDSLERTAAIELEDSAPYDIDTGTLGAAELAWVVDMGRSELLQIDAATAEVVARYETARGPTSVNVFGESVYVTSNDDHVVQRFDAATGEVAAVYEMPDCANDVELADGSLWVTDYCGNAVHRIDEDGSEPMVSIPVPEAPSDIEVGDGLVWLVTQDGIVRIDPEANEVVGNTIFVPGYPDGLHYMGGEMYVYALDGVFRLDEDLPPATPPPTPSPEPDPRDAPLPDGVERVEIPREAGMLAVSPETTWASLFTIYKLDAATGELVAEIGPDHFAEALDYDEEAGLLWALVEVAEKESLAILAMDATTDEVVVGPVLLDPPGASPNTFDAAGGSAWFAGAKGMLFGVHSESEEVTRIDVGEYFGAGESDGLHTVVTDEAVLVLSGSGVLVRVDPSTGAHQQVGDLGWNISDTATDGEMIWVAQSEPAGKIVLWTLDGDTGDPVGDPVEVGEYGYVFMTEHDGMVWVVQGGGRGGRATIRAYEGGKGEPVRTVEVPDTAFMQDVAAGPSGLWMSTGHEFLYKIAPE